MKNLYCLIFIAFTIIFTDQIFAQPEWKELPNAPYTTRHDDGFFLNENLGWVVGRGLIWKTTDGGNSWIKQFDAGKVYFRSIGFFDSLTGVAGNLGTKEFGGQTDTNLIYRTTNGGVSWEPVNNFIGPKPRGICGLNVVNDSVIVGVGRVRGPVYFLKSTDKGETWHTKSMSAYAMDLMDIYFTSEDTGFVVGGSGDVNESSHGIILHTVDGGENWTNVYTGSQLGAWCWKINFPSKNIGYVSLQRDTGTVVNIVKTTDAGKTWHEKFFTPFRYYVQGIGFINDSVGWAGGNSDYPTFETIDGGESWHNAGFGSRVNRFRKINDTVAYAMGRTIYKYSNETSTGIIEQKNKLAGFELKQNYPNPFNPSTTIEFSIPKGIENNSLVLLKVFNTLGEEIRTIFDEVKEPGNYKVIFDAKDPVNGISLPSGVYFYTLQVENYSETKKFILIK